MSDVTSTAPTEVKLATLLMPPPMVVVLAKFIVKSWPPPSKLPPSTPVEP